VDTINNPELKGKGSENNRWQKHVLAVEGKELLLAQNAMDTGLF